MSTLDSAPKNYPETIEKSLAPYYYFKLLACVILIQISDDTMIQNSANLQVYYIQYIILKRQNLLATQIRKWPLIIRINF